MANYAETYVDSSLAPIHYLQNHIGELTRLENAECLRAYASSSLESDWASVLVVTSLKSEDNLFKVWEHDPRAAVGGRNDESWVCDGLWTFFDSNLDPCDLQSLIARADNWTIPNVSQCRKHQYLGYQDGKCKLFPAPIEYCLAKTFPPRCKVQISTTILSTVIACNIVKIICLALTAISRNFEPLVTVGDAISSFLKHPEPLTSRLGPLSIIQVRKRHCSGQSIEDIHYSSFRRQTVQWVSALGMPRILICIFMYVPRNFRIERYRQPMARHRLMQYFSVSH